MREEGGGDDDLVIEVPAGTEDEQDAEAVRLADEAARDWVRDGDWGTDGAVASVCVVLEDDDSVWPEHWLEVVIDPDHATLMREAGAPDDCDHEWTADGEGGCRENPGVWSTGGTAMTFQTHCVHCGLVRVRHTTGVQRNPGEHDTVEYHMPAQHCED